ncbi:N-acetylglucosamine kinase [Micromonospora coerulea]|uniref:N-acetylglucosamine kinase n=1 Tax=Micromonospora coerulea TaxID=47856 RepID=UPI001905AE6E|nr:BadF/BadG/BcrA/BcrD ATPase family protein [Micromonospora veneta]
MPRLVLAVDGGNSKTDVALMNADGLLLSWVRGPGSALGAQRTAALVTRLAGIAARDAGLATDALARAHGAYYLAGADLPVQVDARREAIAAQQVLTSVEVGNDAWALLRLGVAAAAPAVVVVCGAGLKCVARAGDERYEFPGLGWQTGDLSGAGDFLAREAVRVAARAEDGRGPDTGLRKVIREQLAVPSVRAVAERMLAGTLAEHRLGILAPAVLDCARDGDAVASAVVDSLAVEVGTLACTARRRLPGSQRDWTLVLGGGLFADPDERLLAAVRAAAPQLDTDFTVTVPAEPPVAGAALLGFDHLGFSADEAVRAGFRDAAPRLVCPEELSP